ncbi:uncharacterized protein Dvir_GJ26471 [Drosophila virilis]|uniref:Uncharacterized protein n=1 Tax=Drosophila virilis TaxID=7244 RepID=A0A0Q9WT40_DROVI|nr:uncharacterized protein Dvir_GJ26471 [Drosophila virilis]
MLVLATKRAPSGCKWRVFHNRTLNNNPNSRHNTNNNNNNNHACGVGHLPPGAVPHTNHNNPNNALPFLAGTPGTYNRTTNRLNHGPLLTATHYNICKNQHNNNGLQPPLLSRRDQQQHQRGLSMYNPNLYGHGSQHALLAAAAAAAAAAGGHHVHHHHHGRHAAAWAWLQCGCSGRSGGRQ